jgi:hypothetical protein
MCLHFCKGWLHLCTFLPRNNTCLYLRSCVKLWKKYTYFVDQSNCPLQRCKSDFAFKILFELLLSVRSNQMCCISITLWLFYIAKQNYFNLLQKSINSVVLFILHCCWQFIYCYITHICQNFLLSIFNFWVLSRKMIIKNIKSRRGPTTDETSYLLFVRNRNWDNFDFDPTLDQTAYLSF